MNIKIQEEEDEDKRKNDRIDIFNIPIDVFPLIFSFLPYQDLLRLERTNHQLQNMVVQDSIWKNLLFNRHPQVKSLITKNFHNVFVKSINLSLQKPKNSLDLLGK